MYSYDMATINSVLPAFANAKDVIICDEVASLFPLKAVQCSTDSAGFLQPACDRPLYPGIMYACAMQHNVGAGRIVSRALAERSCMRPAACPYLMPQAEPGLCLTARPPTLPG